MPDESGARVANPISLISRWKILDNLRRSLVEPATFLLLLFGWLVPGRPRSRWTLGAVFLLFAAACFQLAFGLAKACVRKSRDRRSASVPAFSLASHAPRLLTLVFLGHQTLLSLDAVVRAIFRRIVHARASAGMGNCGRSRIGTSSCTPVDRYLNWMPIFAIGLGLLVWLVQPSRPLPAALPILLLWACSKLVSGLAESSRCSPRKELPPKDLRFLRRSALYTWRYFAEFCTAEHNWLIPDNVQESRPRLRPAFLPRIWDCF